MSEHKNRRRRHIPPVLVEKILPNLPPKSLLRFSTVSVTWKEMILGAEFRRRYRRREMIVLRANTSGSDDDQLALVCPLSSLSTDDAAPINIPLEDGTSASCGELRCIEVDDALCLYNPSTRARRRLPTPTCPPRIGTKIRGSSTSVFAYGIGYDSSTDDYKVLKIHKGLYGEPELYSLRSDRWRKMMVSRVKELSIYINDVFGPFLITPAAVFAGGALHWVVHEGGILKERPLHAVPDAFFILTFDVSTEEFGRLALPTTPLPLPGPYPPRTVPCYKNKLEVYLLRGRLSVCMNYGRRFVVWVMEDGWKKDLEIDYSHIEPLCYSYLRPLYFYNGGDGRVIKAVTSSTDNRKLFIFKEEEEEEEEGSSSSSSLAMQSRSFGSHGYDIVGSFTYVQSLVSLFP